MIELNHEKIHLINSELWLPTLAVLCGDALLSSSRSATFTWL